MKIELTNFSRRHFNKDFKGTKILDISEEVFMKEIANVANAEWTKLSPGYAPFCKLLMVRNYTNAKTGTLPITIENHQYLESGYSSRTEDELPVLSNWLEIPDVFIPRANYLVIVLYTREQLYSEYLEKTDPDLLFDGNFELDLDTDYGIVAILGQMSNTEEPMKPITMMRNALGKEHGGSGVELNKEEYNRSIEFWSKNATIK